MEHNILDPLQTLHRMSSQNLQRHHHCILHDFSVVLEMEHVNCRVIRTRRHQWVLFVETYVRDGLLVELHRLVWLG